ncbi:MAG TPA: hypothetical protein VGR96_20080, partial [Acidobacteriaceae bacterium]|nr:hypothetical protein [Acidobacteriaceae bacterium]
TIFLCSPIALLSSRWHAPLKLADIYNCPGVPPGHFDHMAVHGHRLFVTAEAADEVLVFDARNGKLLHTIVDIDVPHAPVYRVSRNQLYISYGGSGGATGGLKIFDGNTYKPIGDLRLFPHADALALDAENHRLYINDGGGEGTLPYGRIRVISTTTLHAIGTFRVPGARLKRMVLNSAGAELYIDDVVDDEVDVVDTHSGIIRAKWPVRLGKLNIPIALDEAHERLFVGCRSGVIVVFDAQSGKELKALPIAKGIDDLAFDPESGRLYASCGQGEIDVYREQDSDHYKLLGRIPSAPGAKTGIVAPELRKYFLAVPAESGYPARVFSYDIQ